MNHRHTNDDPYYHQSTSTSSSASASYPAVYSQKMTTEQKTPDTDDNLPSVVQADQMNAFIDSYFGDAMTSSGDSKPQRLLNSMQISKSRADEDLETLLKETDDMQDIQNQIQMEQIEMAEKYREERSRQKRAAAARSRYQRMSENERRLYNHRRRLRQLGVDPETMKDDLDAVRTQVKQANAKKAEAARLRYHRMTPEQKRDYNQRRTEAFRRRRQEEEMLLSTPAGRISAEALAKAQQIMVRNARKAESARLRYQKMTQDERKAYNMKRAAAKKTRKEVKLEDSDEYQSSSFFDQPLDGSDDMIVVDNDEDEDDDSHLEELSSSSGMHLDSDDVIEIDDAMCEEHMLNVINEVAHPPNELGIFTQMENEVLRRTKKANATIMKQHHYHPSNAIVGGIQYDLTQPSPESLADAELLSDFSLALEDLNPSQEHHQDPHNPQIDVQNPNDPRIIDEQALHDMVSTGLDPNGLPVEIRTVEGQRIHCIQDLLNISHGQTVLITQRMENKPIPFENDPSIPSTSLATQDDHVGSTSSHIDAHYDNSIGQADDVDFEDDEEEELPQDDVKVKMVRARRAERARARYHRMSEDQRREQNARRALMLRKARARDDELLKLAEKTPADQIDEATAKAIKEAQQRRARRAEQARSKYRRMNSEERRKYNANREAHKKNKKEYQQNTEIAIEPPEPEPSTSSPVDPDDASSFFYGIYPANK